MKSFCLMSLFLSLISVIEVLFYSCLEKKQRLLNHLPTFSSLTTLLSCPAGPPSQPPLPLPQELWLSHHCDLEVEKVWLLRWRDKKLLPSLP